MTLEAPRVPEPGFGSLQSCLVEGDPQSEKRARRIKQRAVAISIALQTIALAVLVLFPLLSRGERISMKVFTPIPPFRHGSPAPPNPGPRQFDHRTNAPCLFCRQPSGPIVIDRGDSRTIGDTSDSPIGSNDPIGDPNGTQFAVEVPNSARSPEKPVEDRTLVRRKISELQQMAQLIVRVEPDYPKLAIQIRREGRVELHAIIGTDGTIQSLEVISGDPFFMQSALSAVRQWRYRPTILNGQAIEVDTHITVIYTLSH